MKSRQTPSPADETRKKAERLAAERLVGRRIVEARYMSAEERIQFEWFASPLVLRLDDGSFLIPQRDDEGNGGGAVYLLPSSGSEPDHLFGTI